MIKNNNGESLAGIIIGIFILSFVILGVTNLLINSRDTINVYDNKKIINILKNNTENIIKEIDTSKIKETEIFYLYKDTNDNSFKTFTGSANNQYKYIDTYGNKIDNINSFIGDIYARTLYIERDDNSYGSDHQIIKVSIKKLIKN